MVFVFCSYSEYYSSFASSPSRSSSCSTGVPCVRTFFMKRRMIGAGWSFLVVSRILYCCTLVSTTKACIRSCDTRENNTLYVVQTAARAYYVRFGHLLRMHACVVCCYCYRYQQCSRRSDRLQ